MILIFDCFETIVRSKYMDFNRGLAVMWEKYYKDKCTFEEIAAYGEELPMYVLSNSGFSAGALSVALERLGIRKYFKKIWSSADYGRIKPCRDFFEMAITNVLLENPDEKREYVVYVGDTYDTDVVGANAVGIGVIWLNHKGERNKNNLDVYSIGDTRELVRAVKGLKEKCGYQK